MGGGIKSKICHNIFEEIVSLENLFAAWQEFKKGKSKKADIQKFELLLEDNIFSLWEELKAQTYRHSYYTSFYVNDSKRRHIHKAIVRDRLVHHAVFRALYPIFNQGFIFDSYSCRLNKGTHRAVKQLKNFLRKASKNNRQTAYILKCDISRFFDSVDHRVLLALIQKKITDERAFWLIREIVESFNQQTCVGIPLGNVTSQLFANIYLNELDQFLKHKLKAKHYLRYSDDFIIVHHGLKYLVSLVAKIKIFLSEKLYLCLHPKKVFIRKYFQGIDFLGYVVLPYHTVLRTKTKRRMLKKLQRKKREVDNGLIMPESFKQSLQSYLGMLKHCNGYKIQQRLLAEFS